MEKGKQLVYPRVAFDKNGHITTWDKEFQGLNKREYFAGLAMQALITNGKVRQVGVAICAVAFADDLLKELEKDGNI